MVKHLCTILVGILFWAVPLAPGLAQVFSDSDWNTELFANCDLPVHVVHQNQRPSQSVVWAQSEGDQKLFFQLLPGDEGGCSSDHSRRDGAPYWERAELRQYGSLNPEQKHEILFEATFLRGFMGKRETFFQIHGWTKTCQSPPILMLQFDWHYLNVMVLEKAGTNAKGRDFKLRQVLEKRPRIEDLANTNKFRIYFDPFTQPAQISIWLNGQTLIKDQPVHFSPCAELFTKFGVYRPGHVNPGASELLLDDVLVVSHRAPNPQM